MLPCAGLEELESSIERFLQERDEVVSRRRGNSGAGQLATTRFELTKSSRALHRMHSAVLLPRSLGASRFAEGSETRWTRIDK
jgi:hypothetical protein